MMNSFFELNVVRQQDGDKVYNDERVRFHSLVEAEQEMLRISMNPNEFEQEKIFCFIIREIPFDQMCRDEDDILSERVYLPDGNKMDERLFPSGSLIGIFYGRLKSQIRFQVAESVRVLDLVQKRTWIGFVYAVPRLVEEVKALYDDHLPLRLDASDDSYVILDRPLAECKTDDDYMSSHSHISALRVFTPINYFTMDKQEIKEFQQLYEAEMADQSAFARGRRALFDDDYERAHQCFQKAVSEGHAEAMTFLGYMFRKGLGVHRDDAKAAVLYRQAINTGGDTLLTSVAYNNLGVLFMKGEGVAQNLTKAKELFQQAIDFDGSEDSKRHLKEL